MVDATCHSVLYVRLFLYLWVNVNFPIKNRKIWRIFWLHLVPEMFIHAAFYNIYIWDVRRFHFTILIGPQTSWGPWGSGRFHIVCRWQHLRLGPGPVLLSLSALAFSYLSLLDFFFSVALSSDSLTNRPLGMAILALKQPPSRPDWMAKGKLWRVKKFEDAI